MIEHGTHSAYVHLKCRCDECRAAEKEYQRNYRQQNRQRLNEYDRRPERDTRLRDDPEKRKARERAYDTLARDREKEPCEECGSPDSQLHHVRYDWPLDVRWLCISCHGIEHQIQPAIAVC
jgi:hypothetical protein